MHACQKSSTKKPELSRGILCEWEKTYLRREVFFFAAFFVVFFAFFTTFFFFAAMILRWLVLNKII
jgi:hypothetical protein